MVAIAFVLAIALVAWGGWALWSSMVSHRATADETLRDHAAYMSINYSGMYGTESWYLFRHLFVAAEEASLHPGQESISSLLKEAAKRSFEEEPPRVTPVRLFAGDSTGWATTAGTDPIDIELAARLDRRIGPSTTEVKSSFRGLVMPGEPDTTLVVLRQGNRPGGASWVGFEIPLAAFREMVLLPAPKRTEAFFTHVYDSLPDRRPPGEYLLPIAAKLITADNDTLLNFNPGLINGWTMDAYALSWLPATLYVTVGPDAIPYLMPGGYPPAPGPRVAAMIILALLLLGGSAVMAWRTLALSRAREEFTHAVSHELRTPLANIHLYAETLLLERTTDPAARRSALETITRETRRLGDMVENVLATARMARAEETLTLAPDRLERLVHEVLDAFQPLLASRGIEVDVDLEGADVADIDADAVRRILVNLIDNAIRHGPERQRLRVVVDHTSTDVLLIVEDEGPGIPSDEWERVWLPYSRSQNGGSGLGLAVVRHLARLHGGDAVVGEHSGGARIEVRLATRLKEA